MFGLNIEQILIVVCAVIVVSYLFSILARIIRVPSVLLLLFAGVGLSAIGNANGYRLELPGIVVEGLGVVGLIMIVLEAGLDLKLERKNAKLIRDAFFSALVIFLISAAAISFLLYQWLSEDFEKCIVYAIPLSIMSSTIVIPSLHPLTQQKKNFLIYEASFSDILGILLFNYFTAREILTVKSAGYFTGNILLSILLSLVLSVVLFLILARTKLNIKFFLIFSLLILIYAGGKMIGMPSLMIILVFGLMINNWELLPVRFIQRTVKTEEVEPLRHLLHSITAESSFLVRTFFFLLFGYSIPIALVLENEVILIGSIIVVILFLIRLLYLRFFVRTNLFPEAFFIPRGLITIVLFYKIPENLKLSNFNDGILFFIILSTSVLMALGMIFYKKGPEQVVEEPQFADRKDIL